MTHYTRADWKAPAPQKVLSQMNFPVSNVYLHHSVTPVSNDSKADMLKMNNSVVPSKYVDVPYNEAAHSNGDTLEGRYKGGQPALGAHTGGHNSDGVGIVALGNFQAIPATPELIGALATIIARYIRNGWVTRSYNLIPHRQVKATACPSDVLTNNVNAVKAKVEEILGGKDISYTPIVVPRPIQKPATTAPAYPMLLKKRVKNNHVKQVQQRLNDRGWKYKGKKLAVDGDYYTATEQVVKWFQADKGLAVDGIVGKNSWAALFRTDNIT